jgi:hypothetical protein
MASKSGSKSASKPASRPAGAPAGAKQVPPAHVAKLVSSALKSGRPVSVTIHGPIGKKT